MEELNLLPGVSRDLVSRALTSAGGNEIGSGKFGSPESSAALAVNAFGWFLERPAELPPFPPLSDLDWPALIVQIEKEMRFPWSGGRHPWLDAAVLTATNLIGVESKRFEPFRGAKTVQLSEAYDRDVWGSEMARFTQLRDDLRTGRLKFEYLDAAQLLKHAFGMYSEGLRIKKTPVLLYIYAEPSAHGTSPISPARLVEHRAEIERFADAVSGGAVRFAACSYQEWLRTWPQALQHHAEALTERFKP